MAQFNQRGQHITGQQYNAGHDISFSTVQTTVDLTAQLEHLQKAVSLAAERGLLPEEVSIDADAQLKKALIQTRRSAPEKKILLDHLAATKTLIETSTTATDLIPAVIAVIEAVHKSFP